MEKIETHLTRPGNRRGARARVCVCARESFYAAFTGWQLHRKYLRLRKGVQVRHLTVSTRTTTTTTTIIIIRRTCLHDKKETWKGQRSEENVQIPNLTGESSSQGAFINNAEDVPGGRSLGVKATRGDTRQTAVVCFSMYRRDAAADERAGGRASGATASERRHGGDQSRQTRHANQQLAAASEPLNASCFRSKLDAFSASCS